MTINNAYISYIISMSLEHEHVNEIIIKNMENVFQEMVQRVPVEEQPDVNLYLSTLDKVNQQACIIAYQHLESSFDILRSNGYKQWLKNK